MDLNPSSSRSASLEYAPPASDDSNAGAMARIGRALRHRNYRLYFGGQAISLIGTFLTNTATSWLVLSLARDPLQVAFLLGVVGFASQIPLFVISPFAGVWVDRLNKQRMLVITQSLAMLQSFALAYLALSHHINLPLVIALALFQGLVNSFDIPGRQSFVVDMVDDRQDLANAIALNSTMVHGARLIGPAIAGLLIAWVGEGYCFLIDALSYLAVIWALLSMRVHPRERRPARSVISELADGFRYCFGFAPIRNLLLLMTITSLTAAPALTGLTPIFGAWFGGEKHGAMVFGLLLSCSGAGALVGALLLAARKSVVGLARMIWAAAMVFALALALFAFSHWLWLSMLIIPFCGWGLITLFASANTIMQTITEDHMRGRVMAFFAMAFVGVTPFGFLLMGWLATHLTPDGAPPVAGASRAMLVATIALLIGATAYDRMLPAFRRLVRPIYERKGIIPAVAVGLRAAANATRAGET